MIFSFLSGLFKNKGLLLKLAKNDFQARYNGNLLGVFWAFIQPAITILISGLYFKSVLKVSQ